MFKLLSENKLIICALGNLHYQISREKFEPEPGFEPLDLYHLSYPGSHASSRSNLPLETDGTLAKRCGHDTICHLLTTSELLCHLNMNMIFKSNL